MAGRLAGQTINDRLLAAKHSIAGQGLAKSVCKATTEEMIGPKKKHLDYLVQCTNEPNVSIPQLANLLIERSQNTNWVVVYKALITVHHMMCYGNERFTQYLASSNSSFQLSSFLDKSGVQGMLNVRPGYDMSPFIRRYARYINEKALSYRTVAFDFCKSKGNEEGSALRTMHAEKLLKTIPSLQSQLDALLEFDCSANDLTNGVINMSFMLLFRDLIRLFACYNNGIINLLEKFFDMNKKQGKEALDIYKKFLVRMDRVSEFLKVAENIGINKGDIPDLTKAPSTLLDALEQHLAAGEGGKKSSTSSTPSQNASNQKNVRSAVTALSSTSTSFGTVVANGRIDNVNSIDESLKLQLLAEEEAAMNQFKTKLTNSPPTTANNPFFSNNQNQSDPFAGNADKNLQHVNGGANSTSSGTRPSDDLLLLNNPFVDAFSGAAAPQAPSQNVAFQLPVLQQPNNINAWVANGNGYTTPSSTLSNGGSFVSDVNFQNVFGNTEVKTADGTSSNPAQSFNPFLVEDKEPSLLLDMSSPTSNHTKPPIQEVLSYFQKDNNLLDETRINETSGSSSNEKADCKISVDESLNLMMNDNKPPPPRPPPPSVGFRRPSLNNAFANNPSRTSSSDSVNLQSATNLVPKGNGFDPLGGVLQPMSLQGNSQNINNNQQQLTNHMITNNNNINNNGQSGGSALLTGDLESSLASLAENLSINSRPAVKEIQWNSPKNGSKNGASTGWAPSVMSATTGANYKPMNQSMTTTQSSLVQAQMFVPVQPMMSVRPMVANNGTMMGNGANIMPPMSQQQSLLFH